MNEYPFPQVHKVCTTPVQYRQALIRLGKNTPDMTLLELSKRVQKPISWILSHLWGGPDE